MLNVSDWVLVSRPKMPTCDRGPLPVLSLFNCIELHFLIAHSLLFFPPPFLSLLFPHCFSKGMAPSLSRGHRSSHIYFKAYHAHSSLAYLLLSYLHLIP